MANEVSKLRRSFENILVKQQIRKQKREEKTIPAQYYLSGRGKYWEHEERKLLNTVVTLAVVQNSP